MYILLLGRQPALGVAELEQLYGSDNISWFSSISAIVDSDKFNFNILGGCQKAGRIIEKTSGNWRQISTKIINKYTSDWSNSDKKITLGISVYGFNISPRDVQKTGLIIKSKLKNNGVSVRLIPNSDTMLNTATSHHNKLGLSKNHIELLIVQSSNNKVIIAESVGSQNITSFASRDQARPKTDAFVGMLPPKLARIMINMSGLTTNSQNKILLDPFCGTGVILQESAILGFTPYGTDLSDKMIEYSKINYTWLADKYDIKKTIDIATGDATNYIWKKPIDTVVCETYLGQPFNTFPATDKLNQVKNNCNHIINDFLVNLRNQLKSGSTICIAVPAWKASDNHFIHLPIIKNLEKIGFRSKLLKNIQNNQLLYYRENQIVARELLILEVI